MAEKGRVLIIAGSDSGGGAGVQADIKTVAMLGGYATTAITAVTAQNTRGVFGVHEIPAEMVRDQICVVLEDIGADAVKTGMLGSAEIVEAVAVALDAYAPRIPAVVDPVMAAKGGAPLADRHAVDAIRSLMLPRARLITPNAPEAARLVRLAVASLDDQKRAAEALLGMGARAALVKGGHVPGDTVRDVLASEDGLEVFEASRIESKATHGTGCTLASAIAAGLAQGKALKDAVASARAYLRAAIENAPGLGEGDGPLGHAWALRRGADASMETRPQSGGGQ